MYPKLWEASGISYPELIDRLIQLGIERYKREQKHKHRFFSHQFFQQVCGCQK